MAISCSNAFYIEENIPTTYMQTLAIIATLSLAYTIYNIVRFLQSYHTARKTGLPICFCLANFQSSLWRIFSVPLRPVFKRYLPESISFGLEMGTYGSEFIIRDEVLAKYGSSVIVCGIGSLQFWAADKEIATTLMQKPREYPPAGISQEVMGMCGPNIVSVNGESWSRQRKVIAPMINERISGVTWQESVTQAEAMVQAYMSYGKNGTATSVKGLKQLAFNVLGVVAYGKTKEWEDPSKIEKDSASGSPFLDVLLCLTENLVAAALVPTKLLSSPIMPAFVREIGDAMNRFPKITQALIDEERQTRSPSNNLMSSIVKWTDGEADNSKLYLTPEEIQGNLFQFTLAGYDTTANTMSYAVALLAIHPHWQGWMREEIDEVSRSGQDYDVVFPKLKRVLAVMFETLRLYTPVVHILRTNLATTTLKTDSGSEHTIPANTEITVSMALIHANPAYWGKDAREFNPGRWILEDGTMFEPIKGTFLPWSGGPRICPGVKMAQVEFVSTFYTIFRQCRIEPVWETGETFEMAKAKLEGLLKDSAPLITIQMNRPEEVNLRWLKRDLH